MRLPIAINQSEAILEPFWDARITPLPEYRLVTDGNGNPWGARATQSWCWATLAWDRAPRGRPVLALERTMDVDLKGYDLLLLRLAAPRDVRISLSARIDGEAVALIRRAPGEGDPAEYEAPLPGSRLTGLVLELESESERAGEAWLTWIGCAHAGRRTDMLSRGTPYTSNWEGELLPAGSAVDPLPSYGFFFDAPDLEHIRSRALSPLYRPLLEQLRARALEAMAHPSAPEEQIGEHYATDQWTYLIRVRERGRRPFFIDAPICAFVGLVDRNPEMSRFAARITLSILHTARWSYTFMQGFPGSTWDIRGFPEAFLTAAVALCVDWAGAWLTPAAHELARCCVAAKGLPKAREAFLRWEYLWSSNQSHMICFGRLLGLLLLERSWPRAKDEIAQVERDLAEIIDRYVHADGSSSEGLNYWSHSFRATGPALAALARRRGRRLVDVAHPKLSGMWGFVGALLTTEGEPGCGLPIADAVVSRIALDAIGMLAAIVGNEWSGLLGECLRARRTLCLDWMPDGVFTLIYGPDRSDVPPPEPPVLARLETAGMVSSSRPWSGSTVRLFLVGSMGGADHGHRDKGSFILEVAGQTFLADRGMTPYQDAGNVPFLKAEEAHNLAAPEGTFQHNPSAAPALWSAEGDAVRLHAAVDTTRVWQSPVLLCRRTVDSPRPELIRITDELDLEEPRRILFYLQTALPVEVPVAGVGSAVIRGRGATLRVSAEWAEEARAEPCGVDRQYTPFNRIVLVSAPARAHRLRTALELEE